MSNIPQEYLDSSFDFGFSAIDEDGVETIPAITKEEISGPILDRISSLENHVKTILDVVERLEQAGTLNLDTDEYKSLIEKDTKEKLVQLEKLILPLLVNLMKSPEKDTIKWPNRSPVIQKQIDKILAITRS